MLGILADTFFVASRQSPMNRRSALAAPERHETPVYPTAASRDRHIGGGVPMVSQDAKHARFARLHRGPNAFLMPNAWDAGSARLLESLGVRALATTSAGLAFSLGRKHAQGCLSRQQILDNARSIVEATSLPVSGDLENGFGPSPDDVALTLRGAIDTGLCGGAIEDATSDPADPIYEFEHAVDRVRAAVETCQGTHFMVTARAENFAVGRPDLEDTIRRLQAFEAVGADVLYAPGLPNLAAVKAVCDAVSRPVNVVVGLSTVDMSVADLERVGVTRISTGGSLARAALGEMLRAAHELQDYGTTTFAKRALSDAETSAKMSAAAPL